jgi:hypothetical protein
VRLWIRSHPSVYPGVSYTLTLDAPLVVRLRNMNKYFCRYCRGMVAVSIFEPSGPRTYLFRFLEFNLYPHYPLRCLPIKGSLPLRVSSS